MTAVCFSSKNSCICQLLSCLRAVQEPVSLSLQCACSAVSVMSDAWRTIARQTPLFMGFPGQEYWTGLPFPSPGGLPDPRMEPASPVSPALASEFFTTEPSGKPRLYRVHAALMNSLAVHPGVPKAGLRGLCMGPRTSNKWRLTYPLVH